MAGICGPPDKGKKKNAIQLCIFEVKRLNGNGKRLAIPVMRKRQVQSMLVAIRQWPTPQDRGAMVTKTTKA